KFRFNETFLDKNRLYFYTKNIKMRFFKRRCTVDKQETMKKGGEHFVELVELHYNRAKKLLEVNIGSANVKTREELDLCANIKPVKIPGIGCDWTFFRENTEGEYALGPNGATFDDMAFNFNIKE
ncbi:MAG: hypothetical protein KAW82_05800, partial [Desulfurellaceae bacterium]|nr:hypothetical protein [Desulfurellaceae bacterium]